MLDKLRETLTSRKFWATVAAAIPLVLSQDWVTLAQLVMVFLAAQAGVDIAGKLRAPTVSTSSADGTVRIDGPVAVSGPVSRDFIKALSQGLDDLAASRRPRSGA